MKVTLRWLREYVDLPTDDPEEIGEVFANLGFAVEDMQILEAPFSGVVVGKVTAVRAHPNADRIRLATVDTGEGATEVVCGAWNFDAGDVIAFSPPGAMLRDPDGNPFEVRRAKIRGVDSPGMIVSMRELGIGEDHEGILLLEENTPLGQDLASLLPFPDVMYDLEVTADRPDAMSVTGLARELAAHYDVPFREPEVTLEESGEPCPVTVTIDDLDGSKRFYAREVRGVTVGPSPLWVQLRLAAVGQRPINNVVDATNYAMLELGHPTHAFDRERLGDTIIVRSARPGETITTLDDADRHLDPGDVVIANASDPVAIGGVMGGASTEVGDDTSDVLIEAAYFNPGRIMFTAKRHLLFTEASARFQRGMDPNRPPKAADRVAMFLVEWAGGTAAPGPVDCYPEPIEPVTVDLALSQIERVLGTAFDAAAVTDYLTRLGFAVGGGDPLRVTAPTRRPDIGRDVDLIEEVARLHGYNNFPDSVSMGGGGGLPHWERRYRTLRAVMVGAGYHEAITFSFIGQKDLDLLDLPEDDHRRAGIRVVNPLRDEEGVMRTTLLPGLLKAAANNVSRGVSPVSLFETGKVFLPEEEDGLPMQPEAMAFVSVGVAGSGWYGGGHVDDALDALGTWALLVEAMGLDGTELRQASPPAFHPQRTAEVVWDGEVIGVVGELHPRVAAAFGLEGRVAAGEIDIDRMLEHHTEWDFKPPSPYPPALFDLAFEVDESVPARSLIDVIDEAAGPLLERRDVFDVFSGPPLADGRKSIAIRFMFRAPDRTLTDEEVAPMRRAIVDAVTGRVDAKLRGAQS